MERFGNDKPDLRFGMELVELTELFATTEFNAFAAPCVKGICLPGGAELSRKRLDELTERAKRAGAKGLVWMKVEADGTLTSPVAKFLSEAELAALAPALGASSGDLLLLVADERRLVQQVLGQLRLDLGRPPVGEGELRYLWVVDFPLFEDVDDAGRPRPAHHLFTMPHPDDLDLLLSGKALGRDQLLGLRSQAYDLVLNGWELGSGSVRIHRTELQERVLAILGIDNESAHERFGFLLDAFRYGAPPHAGFAFGMDRLVAMLAGEENIREVIAFPKTQSGADPLTRAPSELDAEHLAELGLRIIPLG
jgi:aspartyl-tRNA synthetase